MTKKRTCKDCGETKDIKQYNKNKRCIDGYEPRCKKCRKKRRLNYSGENVQVYKDVRLLELHQKFKEVKKLPKSERWTRLDEVLCIVASLTNKKGIDAEQIDNLKDHIHNEIDKCYEPARELHDSQ